MPEQPDHLDLDIELERYLDGALDEEQRREFERRLEHDEQRRSAVRRQALIDAVLRSHFQPPMLHPTLIAAPAATGTRNGTAGHAAANAPAPSPPHAARDRRRWWAGGWALAAAITLAAVGAWQIWSALGPSPQEQRGYGPWVGLVGYYEQMVAEGMQTNWVCEDDEEFRRTFVDHYRHPLLLGALPAGVSAEGLTYAHTISPRSICLLGHAHGDPVIVFIDRLERDTRPTIDPATGLHLFRREVGGLVLYELTPRSAPALLPALHQPEGAAALEKHS